MQIKELPARPRIRMSYHVIPMSDNRVQLRSGSDAFIMQGEPVQTLIKNLFPLLTGDHTVESILEKLSAGYPRDYIVSFLHKLTLRRVLEDAALEPSLAVKKEDLECHKPQLTYFSHYSRNPYDQQARLRLARVAVCGLGPLGVRTARSLASAGVGEILGLDENVIVEEDVHQCLFFKPEDLGHPRGSAFEKRGHEAFNNASWKGIEETLNGPDYFIRHLQEMDYLVVCQESFQPQILEWINHACLELKLTWTWCALDGHTGTIGPTIIPKQLACWKCYDLRVKANVDHYEEYLAFDEYLRKSESNTVRFGYLLPSLDLIAGLTALEVIKDLSGLTPPLTYGAQISVNLLTTEFDLHPVLKLPRCPVCGRLDDQGAMVRPFLEKAR